MEEQMKLEMQVLIEKHLPAQMGTSLVKLLDQGKKDAATVLSQSDQISKLQITVNNLEKRIKDENELVNLKAKLDVQSEDLKQRELSLELKTLEYQIQAEKDKTKFAQDVAMGLVRNTEYRKSAFDSKNVPYTDNNGYQQYGINATSNHSSTESAN